MASIPVEYVNKSRMNKEESALSSDRDFRRPGALDSAPIDAFEEHRKLRATEVHGAAFGLRPDEAAALKPLGEQAKAIAVPPQQLHNITSAAAENEDMPGERLLLKHRLHLRAQAIEAAAHIGHAGGDPDLRARRKLDHLRRLSRTCRTNAESAPLSTLIIAMPGNSMWMEPATVAT